MVVTINNIKEDNRKKKIRKIATLCLVIFLVQLVVLLTISIIFGKMFDEVFPEPAPQKEIIKSVTRNLPLFEQAVIDIDELDKYIYSISHTKYFPINDNSNYNGLYSKSEVSGKNTYVPIENKTLTRLFLKAGVKEIYVYDNSIEFAFQGSWRDYYCGAVWSRDGKPVVFGGQGMGLNPEMSLRKERNGWAWKESGGDNNYYIEKIVSNWYYYEMTY